MQLEPVYGGRQDTAVELRGLCADALVKFHYPDVVDALGLAPRGCGEGSACVGGAIDRRYGPRATVYRS